MVLSLELILARSLRAVVCALGWSLGNSLGLLFCCSHGSETELSEGQEVIFYVHLPHV